MEMEYKLSTLTSEQKTFEENLKKNETAAQIAFPNERWVNASSIKLRTDAEYEIPKNADRIMVAQSRLTPSRGRPAISDNDARTLAKELRQAGVLTNKGASVFILPKMRGVDSRYIPGPDALVNGSLYEFKTVTGSIGKVEHRFRESRAQGQNVYIRVMNTNITRGDIIRKLYGVINDPNYTSGYKGNLIFSVRESSIDLVYYVRISDLKRKKIRGATVKQLPCRLPRL